MVPGFLTQDPRPSPTDSPVALAGWEPDNSAKKACGPFMTATFCTGLVLWCREFRMCRWIDSAGVWEESLTPYPCGICVGITSPDDW